MTGGALDGTFASLKLGLKESSPFGEASPGVGAEDSCQPLGGSGQKESSWPFPRGIGSAWWQIPGGVSVFVVWAIL